MKLLKADWLITCDEYFTIIENGCVVFGTHIIEYGEFDDIVQKYSNIQIIQTAPNSIILPGLINPHVHLEFSANKTTLKYGNFMTWLSSVIESRADLIEKADSTLIDDEIKNILFSGTTTLGAVSSYGFDIQSCLNTPLNIVYFSEIIGSNAGMIDALFSDFQARLSNALNNKSERFIPAIAIHSPYSVHPFLIRETLKLATQHNLSVTAHFLESNEEKEWLESSSGGMLDFFKNFLNQTQSITKAEEFLNQFKGIENLSFTHCCQANQEELEKIDQLGGTIIHCPVSNRFLTNTTISFDDLRHRSFALGTDGLSSNYSLSLWEEMKNALFIHKNENITELATKLLKASTRGGAKALGMDKKGKIAKDFDADIITVTLPDICDKNNVVLQMILHTKKATKVFIKGEKIV
ncbi:metal-dependent hydrolase [Arcobacter sp. FWKO B]|uniref:aminofutalosine deaminase family hydrolase n=1 Tax=Arcobacter sp. FWKO B TaxID=2593672 RepID=UPI0018A49C4A|nr:metal-dependent hydrolase [Arcobacter sp. FWKO B]QOG11608.1 metal-dependent hydrolase [Arcobacter sp. FWKO B]